MLKKYLFRVSVLAFLLLSISAYSNDPEVIEACLPKKYFLLNELSFTDNLVSIIKKYGKPKSIDQYFSEDDGGKYTGKVLIFENFEVNINELRGIERVSTNNKKTRFALGVHVGMTLSEVSERMHFIPLGFPLLIKLKACGFDYGVTQEVVLRFTSDEDLHIPKLVLSQIEIVQYGP